MKIIKNVLVTGGAGYIGSLLVPELLKKNYAVTVVDNLLFNQNPLAECCQYENFHFIKADIRNYDLMDLLIARANLIIPLACIVGAPACNANKQMAQEVNYAAHVHIASRITEDQCVLFPTTNSGYGVGGKEFCTEESSLNPISSYGRWKVEIERLFLGKGAITFRFATAFGVSPRMRMDLLLNDFVYKAYKDKSIILFEDHFRRNFIHVRDIVYTFLSGVGLLYKDVRGESYNAGNSSANLTKKQLCAKIKEYIPELYIHTAAIGKDPDKRDYFVSNEKLEKTGWKCSYSLNDGILELLKYYPMLPLENRNA